MGDVLTSCAPLALALALAFETCLFSFGSDNDKCRMKDATSDYISLQKCRDRVTEVRDRSDFGEG